MKEKGGGEGKEIDEFAAILIHAYCFFLSPVLLSKI